jgi:hypothetical protein
MTKGPRDRPDLVRRPFDPDWQQDIGWHDEAAIIDAGMLPWDEGYGSPYTPPPIQRPSRRQARAQFIRAWTMPVPPLPADTSDTA